MFHLNRTQVVSKLGCPACWASSAGQAHDECGASAARYFCLAMYPVALQQHRFFTHDILSTMVYNQNNRHNEQCSQQLATTTIITLAITTSNPTITYAITHNKRLVLSEQPIFCQSFNTVVQRRNQQRSSNRISPETKSAIRFAWLDQMANCTSMLWRALEKSVDYTETEAPTAR